MHYGVGSITGYVASDSVALTKSTKYQAQGVNFLSVFDADNLNYLESDGLIGLSPKRPMIGYNPAKPLKLLINSLTESHVIKSLVFAVFLGDQHAQSKVQFGGYDQKLVEEAVFLRPEGSAEKAEPFQWFKT